MAPLVILACFTLLTMDAYALGSPKNVFRIGAILDEQSPVGQEQLVALNIAVQTFNSKSDTLKLTITIKNSSTSLLSSVYAAEELIKESKVKTIIGMNQWVEAAAVAEIGSQASIPIISFSEPAFKSEFARAHRPYLVSMATDDAEQIKCISAIIRAYNWKRIVAIYEENLLGGSTGKLALLAEQLQVFDAEIEYNLAIPPLSTLSSPESTIEEALQKLTGIKPRVFVVLQMSLPVTVHLFEAAKKMGFVEANTAWILTESVANYLDVLKPSVMYSMEGVLGVRNYYATNTNTYNNFRKLFRKTMIQEYPDSDALVPGLFALRAYDAITMITKALKRSPRSFSISKKLLAEVLSSDFLGGSGQIKFDGQRLNNSVLSVVNVVGNSYKGVDLWYPGHGFSIDKSMPESNYPKLSSQVIWPGNSVRDPKGWAVPTKDNKFKIVVPVVTLFDGFVKVIDAENGLYNGFCIELFKKALERLHYPWDFFMVEARDGPTSDLVNMVSNKTYDGLVGDITMLAERVDKVQFTTSYMDSGLSMIVPAVSNASAWMFVKPFTWSMWAVAAAVLIYTTFVVWFMERRSSPELGNTWKDQMGNAVMFTLSSLFFVQRERLHNNLTRVVLIVWLFLVLVLNSSYTASLSSMLTARRLRPSITEIEYLVKNNLKVACDPKSFLFQYLRTKHQFKTENIVSIQSAEDVLKQFESKNISAAFFETAYKRSFFNHLCGKEIAEKVYDFKFGGLAFAFQKGSPFGEEISKELLKLQEEGEITRIEDASFSPFKNCGDERDLVNKSLELRSFWALYVISAATSTFCLLLFVVTHNLKSRNHSKSIRNTNSPLT